jgi:hypothetical protein
MASSLGRGNVAMTIASHITQGGRGGGLHVTGSGATIKPVTASKASKPSVPKMAKPPKTGKTPRARKTKTPRIHKAKKPRVHKSRKKA